MQLLEYLIRHQDASGKWQYLNGFGNWSPSLNGAEGFTKQEAERKVREIRRQNIYRDAENRIDPQILEI